MGKSKKSKQSETAPGPKVVCFFCEAEFAEEGTLILHQQTKHFKCTACSGFQGGRCPAHGCRHKCLVTLSCHWKKDHKGELMTIPGTKEGRDDPKKFWRVHGVSGTPDDFQPERNMPAPIPSIVVPPIPDSELPPIPDQPPLPPMPIPDLLTEWHMSAAAPDQLPAAAVPGLQGDGSIGAVVDAESLPPSTEPEVPDFARQVQEWMAAKGASKGAVDEEIDRSNEHAPQMSFPMSSASSHISSVSPPSDAFNFDFPTTLAKIPDDWSSMETQQREQSGYEPTPRSQEWPSRSRDRHDRERRSFSRERSVRAAHSGRGSRSRDRQNSRGPTHERDRHEDRMRDDRGLRRLQDQGRDGNTEDRMRDDRGLRRAQDQGRDGNTGRNCAIAITQGHVPSRIWLQKLMSPYGRLEYSHTGNRLNPERDPPWVIFATSGGAEDAMKAISAGMVVDGNGVSIKAEWKKMSGKGKGKGSDKQEISSRDLYKGHAIGQNNRGPRDDRRRGRSSSSSSRSSRRNRARR